MSNSIRIRTTPLGNDKFLKVNIDQDFDFLEILSLKISQEDVYRRFCSDYGVVIGRVVANGGFGIPNAKISVFIPLDDVDRLDNEISSIYPYDTVYSKDSNGVRYNLLRKNFKENDPCFVPVGTMPSKREVLDCDVKLEVFEKYYKFSTTTNESGDYMLFGLPVGEHTIHMDVDLSDIGIHSQKPYELIAQGFSKKQFVSSTQFKLSNNLDNLAQIKSNNSSVSVKPFWGDTNNCEIGVCRLDFDLNYSIVPTSILMGSVISDTFRNGVNKNCRPKPNMGLMKEMVTSAGNIEIIRKTIDGGIEQYVPQGESTEINENGVYCFQIPMNLEPVITDEFGDEIISEDPSIGIPTKAKIRMRTSLNSSNLNRKFRVAKHLTPNRTNDYSFGVDTPDSELAEIKSKKIYTTKQFITRYQKGSAANKRSRTSIKGVDENLANGVNPFPYNRIDPEINPLFSIICLLTFVLLTIVTTLNSTAINILNLVIGLLNSILSILCYILTYTIGPLLLGITTAIYGIKKGLSKLGVNVGGDLKKPTFCDFCINKKDCNGWDCGCDKSILPFIPCIVMECNNERYAPGCAPTCCAFGSIPQCNPNAFQATIWGVFQGWCASGKLQHWGPAIPPSTAPCCSCNHNFTGKVCGNNNNTGHSLANFYGYYDCIQSQMAKSLNLYKFDFYNDYINGTLYFYAYKMKSKSKKNGRIEVFCDYDCHNEFEKDFEGPEHKRNDCSDRSNLVETCVDQGSGSLGNNESSISIKEGLIKDYDGEKYYPAYTHNRSFNMFSSDFICLGSTINCDKDGSIKIIEQLESTTYQIPELSTQTVDDNGTDIEETGADPLLYNIRCTFPQCWVTKRNCANLRKICELGIGLDELREDYEFDNQGNLTNVITTNANCQIDICDVTQNYLNPGTEVENYQVRTELAYSNGVPRTITNCGEIYSKYTGYNSAYLNPDTTNEYFGDYRFLNNRVKNSYYFYFGLYNGKTALDCVINNYFTPCVDINPNKKIAINVNVTNNNCKNGNDGELKIKIINGVSPWSYSVTSSFNSTIIPNGVTNSNLLTFSNLLSGTYTISLTDSKGLSSRYTLSVDEPPSLFVSASVQNTNSPTNKNGTISLLTLNGNPPYNYAWTPKPPNNQTGYLINNLGVGMYSVTVTDTPLNNCSQQTFTLTGITVGSPSGLYFSTSLSKDKSTNYNVSCYGGDDGQINIENISGGTAPYSYYVNGVVINNITIKDLKAGDYTISVYDSMSAQTLSKVVTLTQPKQITASLIGETNLPCYNCQTTLTITNVAGGVGSYSYVWDTYDDNQNSNNSVNVGSGEYTWYVYDSNGCNISGKTIVNQPSILEINNINITDALCYNGNGTVTFDVQGGTAPYTYKIYSSISGAGYKENGIPCTIASSDSKFKDNSNTCLIGLNSATPITLGNVIGGSVSFTTLVTLSDQYYVEVKDSNGCTACRTFTMTSPTQLNLNLTKSLISPGRYSITAIGGGGNPYNSEYDYSLYLGSGCSGSPLKQETAGSYTFNNSGVGYLTGNTYSVQVEDSNNCTKCVNINI